MTSTEVRFNDKQTIYQPEHRTKEWAIALGTILIAFAIIEALIYAFLPLPLIIRILWILALGIN